MSGFLDSRGVSALSGTLHVGQRVLCVSVFKIDVRKNASNTLTPAIANATEVLPCE
jgi:hypothetical protein